MRTITILAISVLAAAAPPAAQPRTGSPIFVLHANDFWLNLHQFLYVLGRHEAGMPDRTRRATVGAPADSDKGVATLSEDGQRTWREAVTFYAGGPSKHDAVFDEPAIRAGQALARAAGSATVSGSGVDPALVATLEKVAPIYRKAWWPAHQRANQAWVESIQPLVDRHGRNVLDFITNAYQMSWDPRGYPIHVTAYANWAGAFSTRGNLLLMSSLDAGNAGLTGFEIAFHEAMHQWDDRLSALLEVHAKKQGTTVPDLLSHALIFYTAGEAVRFIAPAHVPYAESNGLWCQRGLGAFKPALDQVWKPYLTRTGTRDAAFAELIKLTAVK